MRTRTGRKELLSGISSINKLINLVDLKSSYIFYLIGGTPNF